MKLILKRLIAFIIDAQIINLVTLPFQIIMFEIYLEKHNKFEYYSFILVLYILYGFYFYISERYYKTTLGKKIFRLKVEDSDDANYFTRTISRLIPLEFLYFLFNEENKMLHDKLSKTRVIEIKKNKKKQNKYVNYFWLFYQIQIINRFFK